MVDENEFFKQVTVRICSSLDMKNALERTYLYIRKHIPLDGVSLTIRDPDLAALRRVVKIEGETMEPLDDILPLPADLWATVQSWNIHTPTIMNPEHDAVIRQLIPYIRLEGDSAILIPLWVDDRFLGCLVLRARGKWRYEELHVRLLAEVAEPFAIALANALAHERLLTYRDILLDDNRFLNKELLLQKDDEVIGGKSGLLQVMEMVRQVAPLDNSVLLLGETGTGKEVIANAIHAGSPRRDKPFIKVNCGAIPENLIDSELFGHERGAFTGAVAEKRGRFERADGGTLFLDEIGELPLPAQTRLLRVLQEREIERVGGTKPIPVNIRVIAATHRNLQNMVDDRLFREDLWFRLNIFPIMLPPLRQRREDIPALTRNFVARKSLGIGIHEPPAIAPGALQRLVAYDWPGNVRELENLVERELILHRGGQLLFNSIPVTGEKRRRSAAVSGTEAEPPMKLDEVMALHIGKVLKLANGRINGPGGAAELLGLEPNTLRARMNKLGISYRRREQNS
jgi:hydrogenase-4 transcriptional activator